MVLDPSNLNKFQTEIKKSDDFKSCVGDDSIQAKSDCDDVYIDLSMFNNDVKLHKFQRFPTKIKQFNQGSSVQRPRSCVQRWYCPSEQWTCNSQLTHKPTLDLITKVLQSLRYFAAFNFINFKQSESDTNKHLRCTARARTCKPHHINYDIT